MPWSLLFRALPCLVAGAMLLPTSCKSANADLIDDNDSLWAEAAPAPFRIGLAPIAGLADIAQPTEAALGLVVESEEAFQARFVEALHLQRATSELRILSGSGDDEEDLDLILRPRVVHASFEHVGSSGNAVASALLWITTWFGGFLVEDSEYKTDLSMQFEVVDPRLMDSLGRFTLRASDTDLKFFERNKAFNKGFWYSLLVPPFWSTDDALLTSESLTNRSLLQVAALLKEKLSTDAASTEDSARHARVSFRSPTNGSTLGAATDLECAIETRVGVTSVLIYRNGELLGDDALQGTSSIPLVSDQATGSTAAGSPGPGSAYRCEYEVRGVPLLPGRNDLRIVVYLASDQVATRTLTVHSIQQ